MQIFFKEFEFGRLLQDKCEKTPYQYQGKSIYRVTEKISQYGLKENDHFYLDAQHLDHLEVFTKKGRIEFVLNLDGSLNQLKTERAFAEARTIFN